jgi:hypothetical protein
MAPDSQDSGAFLIGRLAEAGVRLTIKETRRDSGDKPDFERPAATLIAAFKRGAARLEA